MNGAVYVIDQILSLAAYLLNSINSVLASSGAGINIFGVLAIIGLGFLIRHAVWG